QPGRRGRLAGAGSAEQHHVLLLRAQPALELVDRRRLVAGGLEVGNDLELAGARRDIADDSHLLAPHVSLGATRSRENRRKRLVSRQHPPYGLPPTSSRVAQLPPLRDHLPAGILGP